MLKRVGVGLGDQTVKAVTATLALNDLVEPIQRGNVARHMWNGHAGKRFFRHFIQRDMCGHLSGLSARSKTTGLDEIRDARG
ncbi:hypothetical protein [Mesorhizobium sp. M0698]|uniref:hypothetical protein n=1 Tax=Mesorhizobium sp. M0698 TaxID=2956987 RepID=UPI00333A069E